MSDQEKTPEEAQPAPKKEPKSTTQTRPKPGPPKRKPLPPWKVILHNDDENDQAYVVDVLEATMPLTRIEATRRMVEAHETGRSLLLTIHRERAELYQQQLTSRNLTATIEPAEDA